MKPIAVKLACLLFAVGLSAESQTSETDIAADPDQEVFVMEPVVVTGYLWEPELQQVTASVSVLEGERLELNGVQHFEDLVSAIPNVTWTGGSSRPRFIQIRGIGENSQFEGETPDSAVRFLIDDLDLTSLGTVGNLFDVRQVEVLRGPQAGSFGANAAGGVIKITTNDPTSYWTGQVEGSLGQDSLEAGGFAIGGPLVKSDPEKLSFRFALHQLNQDGFRDNQYLDKEDVNERDELTTRLKARWLFSEELQIDSTFLYADFNNGYDEWSLENTEFDVFSDEPGRDEQESLAGAIRVTWAAMDTVKVTSITNYSTTDSLYSYDNDWTNEDDAPGNYAGFIENEREQNVFGQEIRVSSVEQKDALGWVDRWTVGLFFQDLKEETTTEYDDDFGTAFGDFDYKTNTSSIFGQIAHDFSDTTRMIIGLRYEYHKVEQTSNRVEDTGSYSGMLSDEDDENSSSLWGGKLTLEHDLNDDQMLFTSFTRGYKAAGANGGVFRGENDPLTYDEETLYNFEVGLNSQWFDAAILSQITAFYLYRDDPQLRDSKGSGGFFRYFTDNDNRAEHCGLEAEATWFISQSLTASAGVGLLETQDDNNDELANSPNYTYNAQLIYRCKNGFFANLEVRGSDDYYESNNKDNRSERTRTAFFVFNGSIGYTYQNWTLTLWGRNLFDEEYEKRVFFFDNDGQGEKRFENPANPQQFGITANYSW